MLRQSLPLFLVLVPIVARAQTPTALPVIIASGTQIQIPVPATSDKVRLQVLLGGSTSVLDDERANVQNGVAVARLEADPGTYDVRVVSNDKARTPLGSARRFFIPGFKREVGRWLFNGSPVVYEGKNPATVTSFVPNLRRDNKKTKLPVVIPTNAPLKWDVHLYGVEFRSDVSSPSISARIAEFQQQRAAFRAANPEGAFLLSEPLINGTTQLYKGQQLDQLAPLSDGIIIMGNGFQDTVVRDDFMDVAFKIARRNAEEAPNFDLPIFAQFLLPRDDVGMLRAFQNGASNLIVPEGTSNSVIDILNRQSARLSGAVTLEDVGLLAKDFDRFAPVLRRAGRVPLLGRLPGEGNGEKKDDDKRAESLFVGFDSATDQAMLDKIERAAKVGATIYCEGALPSPLWKRWSDITKLQIAPVAVKTQTLTLDDPWFWGTINEQNFDVRQTLALTVKPSVSAQIKDVKGEARETVARPIAKFNGDPNGIMLCPVSKGRIIWAPFDVSAPRDTVITNLENRVPAAPRITTPVTIGHGGNKRYINDDVLGRSFIGPDTSKVPTSTQLTDYYAAISGAMQAALVSYDVTRGDASGVSVALRATRLDPNDPKSVAATLVSFFNSSSAPVDLNASIRGDGAWALDLENDQPIPTKVRDFSARLALTVPANGFRYFVVAKDAKTWNDAGKGNVRARLR